MIQLPIDPLYIKGLYENEFRNTELATGASYRLRSLGLLTSELEASLQHFEIVYQARMDEIGKLCTSRFSPRLSELLGKYNHTFVFPSIKDNKISIKIGMGWVSINLLMDITTGDLEWDTFGLSVSNTVLESQRDEIYKEFAKIIRK